MQFENRKKRIVYYLALWGCMATGFIYTAIGVIAMLSFLKLKQGGADEGSLLVYLEKYLAGKIAVYLVLLGMIGYIIWRIYETINDPYNYGRSFKGIVRRSVSALSALADAMIAYSALMALVGSGVAESGRPTALRQMAEKVMQESWGVMALLTFGFITCITAIMQMGYAITKSYMERLNMQHLQVWKRRLIHFLSWAGHFARSIILGIIGFFMIKTAVTEQAGYLVNTDKAFDFIGDHVGHFYFIIVAAGTVFYGLFMFLFGIYYDTDN